MDRFLLTITRFSLSAWVGAAALFVLTGIAEVRSPEFESATKNALAALRFPYYYLIGFLLVGVGLLGSWVLAVRSRYAIPGTRMLVGAMTLASILMNVDYVYVFRPLLAMMSQEVKTESFATYHHASMLLNAAGLGLVLFSAILICAASPRPAGRLTTNQSPM
jgi:hypothetical protein